METLFPRDRTTSSYLSIKGHGAPKRAVWFGTSDEPAEFGARCMIASAPGGWSVLVEGQAEAITVRPGLRVWLAPLPGEVLNPAPVPIRLSANTMGAYVKLGEVLRIAAREADDAAGRGRDAAEWRSVRDALRKAATEALVPRGGASTPRCRRCEAECPHCTPASRCRNCGELIEPVPPGAAGDGEQQYRHKVTELVGCGPDGLDIDAGHTAIAEPGGPRR